MPGKHGGPADEGKTGKKGSDGQWPKDKKIPGRLAGSWGKGGDDKDGKGKGKAK